MKIHTTQNGDTVVGIAKQYSTCEELIREINEIPYGEPTEGEELLILIPTRSYRVRHKDSVDAICLRFGISKNDFYRFNPNTINKALIPGQTVTIGCRQGSYGMSVANGLVYSDCTEERLKYAMPYLTYVTFGCAVADKGKIKKIYNDALLRNLSRESGKINIIRVYDKYPERYDSQTEREQFADRLIELATEGGYKGIMLAVPGVEERVKNYCEFMVFLRKKMIGMDLILLSDINEDSPLEISEYADAASLYYPKFAFDRPPSFKEGERQVLSDFACRGESTKTFIELPSLAICDKGYMTISEALRIAETEGQRITTDENTLLSRFKSRKQGEIRYLSLRGIDAILDLIHEYDYMGICFDVMKTPLSHLAMYNSRFKTYKQTTVRSREGCSRAGEE